MTYRNIKPLTTTFSKILIRLYRFQMKFRDWNDELFEFARPFCGVGA